MRQVLSAIASGICMTEPVLLLAPLTVLPCLSCPPMGTAMVATDLDGFALKGTSGRDAGVRVGEGEHQFAPRGKGFGSRRIPPVGGGK